MTDIVTADVAYEREGRKVAYRAVRTTIVADGVTWTLWMPVDTLSGERFVHAVSGADVKAPAAHVLVRYDLVTSDKHANSCGYRTAIGGRCSCGADTPLAGVHAVLMDAARALLGEASKVRAEETRKLQEDLAVTAWQDEPGRILVSGSPQGWRRWEKVGDKVRDTGEIVVPPGGLGAFAPRFVGVIDNAVGLYSIRAPRAMQEQGG